MGKKTIIHKHDAVNQSRSFKKDTGPRDRNGASPQHLTQGTEQCMRDQSVMGVKGKVKWQAASDGGRPGRKTGHTHMFSKRKLR